MRKETVLSARYGGSAVATAKDGEKVGINDTVVRIYDAGNSQTADRIKEIDEEIDLLRESLSDGTLSLYDSTSVDALIISLMKSIRYADATGDYVSASSFRSELKKKLIKRNIMTATSLEVENMIADLSSARSSLMRSLGTCREEISAPASGYYFSLTDGYESAFTSDAALKMTYSEFSELTASAPDGTQTTSCGKIATEFVWYLACTVNRGEIGKIEEGETRKVSFIQNSNISLDMTVERTVADNGSDNILIVMSCDKMPRNFDFSRVQRIEILKKEYSCFKIPISAMRVIDGIRGVYVLDGSTVYFRAVSVLTQNDDAYLAEISPEEESGEYKWLKLNDNIIIEGTGLYHGRILS